MSQKNTPRYGYQKLIVDGKVVSVFLASQKTPYHARMARLKGCYIQPALDSDYKAFLANNIR